MITKPIEVVVALIREAADDLEALKLSETAEFHMANFGEHFSNHPPETDNYCNTQACAAGWLSLMPKWRERGFSSVWVPSSYKDDRQFLEADPRANPDPKKLDWDWDVMTKMVFGTDLLYTHIFMCSGWGKIEKSVVADRMRELANTIERMHKGTNI